MMDQSPFHIDEIAAQRRAGVHVSGAGVRALMPDQHREFFEALRYVFVGGPGRDGWPLATVLTGAAGFVHAPSATTLRIDGGASLGFAVGDEIGLLGLDLSTRRRNRANGRIAAVDQGALSVEITQSFGNCAQYIHTRTIGAERRPVAEPRTVAIDGLDNQARWLIGTSDTFFVASRSRADAGTAGGLDVSHRGGRPGFVRVEGNTLSVPDFKGNRFFNTLGNFIGDDRAGLLFIDFTTGDLLQAEGRVAIDWAPATAELPAGSQRFWRVTIERSWWRRRALPFAWEFGEYAPTTMRTGVWSDLSVRPGPSPAAADEVPPDFTSEVIDFRPGLVSNPARTVGVHDNRRPG
jgi:predicted pyridoxine 5'-phosphate oxidase superfamily flavin-nucleotide-binding protein